MAALAVAASLVALAAPASAQTDVDVAFNVGVVSDYVFRGVSQTDEEPAIQGGIDITAGSFYAGVWGSNVDFFDDTDAEVVIILNLTPEAGETHGFTTERHIHVFSQHAPELRVDAFLADDRAATTAGERENIARAAAGLDAAVTFMPLGEQTEDGSASTRHDPEKLAAALKAVHAAR